LRFLLGWWVALVVFYVLLSSRLVLEEIVTAAAIATPAVGVMWLVRRYDERMHRITPSMIGRAWTVPLQAIVESVRVIAAGLRSRPPEGFLDWVPFEPAGEVERREGLRALTPVRMTMPPNTIVIDEDREAGLLVLHRLIERPPDAERDPEWPQ
jgi:hypothetical protein